MSPGLVEPVDDHRDSNPTAHEPLLSTLASLAAQSDGDLRELLRTLVESTPYARNIFWVFGVVLGDAVPFDASEAMSRLAKLGHAPERIGDITCPIGDPSLGKHPQSIAIGVAATLLRPATIHSQNKDLSA